MSTTHLSYTYPVFRAIQKTLLDPGSYWLIAMSAVAGYLLLGFSWGFIAVFALPLLLVLSKQTLEEVKNHKMICAVSMVSGKKNLRVKSLVNINFLADSMQKSIDEGEPVLFLQMKINQSAQVARLLETEHIKAEELMTQIACEHIESEFADSTVYRLGKYTFLVWLNGQFADQKRRIEAFSRAHSPFRVKINDSLYFPKLNIGITELSDNVGETITRLEHACDKAFQSAGANCFFVPEDDEEVGNHIRLKKGLRDVRVALHDNSLGLFAQPIVNLEDDSELPKYELLLREFRDGEILPPGGLLQKAEYNHIFQDVDLYVVNLLAENFHEIFGQDGKDIHSVSINVSGDSYTSPRFKQLLISTFHKFGIPSEKVVLEVTENIANNNMNSATETMEEMKAHGFKLALDDIGVGSSNFQNLFRFPVDYFKIDRSYCEGILDNPSVKAFVQIIIDEAKRQGKKTIAEGIPDDETKAVLMDMGVDYSQSFITGRPQELIPAPGSVDRVHT